MDGLVSSGDRPKIMVTNDDGIDAPGLRALVQFLVSTNLYKILVCAPDSYVNSLPFSFICYYLCSYDFTVVLVFEAVFDIDVETLWFMDVRLAFARTALSQIVLMPFLASFFQAEVDG